MTSQIVVEARVHRVFFAVVDHPLRQEASAAGNDPDETIFHPGQVISQHAGVDGEVVDPLLRLVPQALQDVVLGQVLDLATDDHRVDRHRSDGHRRVVDDRLARRVEVAAGGQVHDGVRAPLLRPVQLLDLVARARRDGAGAHVGVDLGSARAADAHRVELLGEVDDVGRDDHATRGDLVAHLLGVEMRLALGHALHRVGHDAQTCVLELGHGHEALGGLPALGGLGPIRRHEVPRRLLARLRHARCVGRREHPRTADLGLQCKRTGCGPRCIRRGVLRAVEGKGKGLLVAHAGSLSKRRRAASARVPYAGANRIRFDGFISAERRPARAPYLAPGDLAAKR